MTEIHNKSVKTNNVDLLIALFPEYQVHEELPPYPMRSKILFTGRVLPNLRNRLQQEYDSYILVSQVGEVTLTTNIEWLRFVCSKFNRNPSKKLEEFCESLEMPELQEYLKTMWLTGKFPIAVEQSDASVYDLFKAIPGPQSELIKTFLSLAEHLPVNVVESSLLTMLTRVKEIDEQEVSVQYKKLLLQCSTKIGNNIKSAVRVYAQDKRTQRELALVNLLLSLRGR